MTGSEIEPETESNGKGAMYMYEFNTIPEALEELRAGRIILVTDDPNRENEGDFICAAEFATTESGCTSRRWCPTTRTTTRRPSPSA